MGYAISGAQVAIVDGDLVLLQLRPWPPGWELPGGHCQGDEEPAGCAAREAEEETGLSITIAGLVGVYSWTGLRRSADAVYWADATGGRPRRSLESLRARFVSPAELPATVFPWIPQRVRDSVAAAAGAPPVHRVQPVGLRHVLFFGGRWAGWLLDRVRRGRR